MLGCGDTAFHVGTRKFGVAGAGGALLFNEPKIRLATDLETLLGSGGKPEFYALTFVAAEPHVHRRIFEYLGGQAPEAD